MGFEEPSGFPLTLVISHVSRWKDGSSQFLHAAECAVHPRPATQGNLSLHALAHTLGGGSQGSSSALIASGCRKNPCIFLGVIFFEFDFTKLARF